MRASKGWVAISFALVALAMRARTEDAGVAGPWLFKHPIRFDVLQTSICTTRLDERVIDYKDRASSDVRYRIRLEEGPGAKTLLNLVVFSGVIRNSAGEHWNYTFDRNGFTETHDEKPVRQFLSAGTPDERASLDQVIVTPWAELTWNNKGNSSVELTAAGVVQPLAETLAIERFFEILLPPIHAELSVDQDFHQVTLPPTPIPVRGMPKVRVTYHVERMNGQIAEIAFNAETDERIDEGFEWGGIPVADVEVRVILHGRLTRDDQNKALLAGELDYDLKFTSHKVNFSSLMKGRSEWRRKD